MDDYAPSMGAALSYYTLFSLAPLLLLVIAVAGLRFDTDMARGQVILFHVPVRGGPRSPRRGSQMRREVVESIG